MTIFELDLAGIKSSTLSGGTATGANSVALGDGSRAFGDQSFSATGSLASGLRSAAFGKLACARLP